jgi:hypothetical protein
MANADYEVEFREAITTAIPSLFQRLTDINKRGRLDIVNAIGKLAVHGKLQSDTTVTWLMQIIKSSCVKLSQP